MRVRSGAANNGSGNNGVLSGIPGSSFRVDVIRAGCTTPGHLDGALIAAALDAIVERDLFDDVRVVNMSFGATGPAAVASGECFWVYVFDSPGGREILWVAAAGNDGLEFPYCGGGGPFPGTPAEFACDPDWGQVVSVSGYDPLSDMRSPSSNYGFGATTISAPNSSVLVASDPGRIRDDLPLQPLAARVEFSDEGRNDRYEWRVVFQELPPGTLFPDGVYASGIDGQTSLPIGTIPDGYVPVLTGFSFNRSGERHLDEIEVWLPRYARDTDFIDVNLRDRNFSDEFDVYVSWALADLQAEIVDEDSRHQPTVSCATADRGPIPGRADAAGCRSMRCIP